MFREVGRRSYSTLDVAATHRRWVQALAHDVQGEQLAELKLWMMKAQADGAIDLMERPLREDYYLHVENGRRYGQYRDSTGLVDGDLLQQAVQEVAASTLPLDTKMRIVARAQAIAVEHGLGHVVVIRNK